MGHRNTEMLKIDEGLGFGARQASGGSHLKAVISAEHGFAEQRDGI